MLSCTEGLYTGLVRIGPLLFGLLWGLVMEVMQIEWDVVLAKLNGCGDVHCD